MTVSNTPGIPDSFGYRLAGLTDQADTETLEAELAALSLFEADE